MFVFLQKMLNVSLEHSVKPFIAVVVSSSSIFEMVPKSFPLAYRIESWAKLQIPVSFLKRYK